MQSLESSSRSEFLNFNLGSEFIGFRVYLISWDNGKENGNHYNTWGYIGIVGFMVYGVSKSFPAGSFLPAKRLSGGCGSMKGR